MKTFAVLQLSGCAGCEVSLLDAAEWLGEYRLAYLPLIMSAHDVPPVDVLLVSGGIRNDEELYKLGRAVPQADKVIAVGTCAIAGGVISRVVRADGWSLAMRLGVDDLWQQADSLQSSCLGNPHQVGEGGIQVHQLGRLVTGRRNRYPRPGKNQRHPG